MTAIDDLYRVFARYPRPRRTDGSPIATTPEDIASLAQYPVGQVPSHTLERFLFKAMSTWGDEDDFRYYLPQILDEVRTSDLWLVVNKLGYASWRDWPSVERQAVAAWIVERWENAVAAGSDELWTVFEAMALLTDDAYARLGELETTTNPRVLEAIARQLADAWSRVTPLHEIDGTLLLVAIPTIRRRLEAAFYAAIDPGKARMYSDAVQLLESLGRTGTHDDDS